MSPKEKKRKYLPMVLIVSIILILFFFSWQTFRLFSGKTVEQPAIFEKSENEAAVTNPPQAPQSDQDSLPEKEEAPPAFQLNVPFLVQAPFAVWDALHEDACEEASLIMVERYLNKRGEITKEEGDQEINKLVEFESSRGFGLSVTLSELNQIAGDYYGLKNGFVSTEVSVESIKSKVAAGQPVIIPAAGKILPNPNFRNGGPNYHMLVITGYDEDEFITNDPGTRNGKDFRYKYDDLINAIHDWDAVDILSGPKAYLVF